MKKAARIYAKADKAAIFYSMGVTQHSTGTDGVMGTSNLALLCGNIGMNQAASIPLRGQNNVQGACDMGGLPGDLPGYQKVANPRGNGEIRSSLGCETIRQAGPYPDAKSSTKPAMGDIKFLYIMGENPMISDPDLHHVEEALKNTEFLVVQDIFLTETAQLADVVLPAASFAEKDGTFSNTERRVQRVRKAIEPVGKAKADWVILMEIMNKLGYSKTYANPAEIMAEIASVTPPTPALTMTGWSRAACSGLARTTEHPGTRYLHKDAI